MFWDQEMEPRVTPLSVARLAARELLDTESSPSHHTHPRTLLVPLSANGGISAMSALPRKRTSELSRGMSALCQKQKSSLVRLHRKRCKEVHPWARSL